jgi:hypothetical protein
VPALAADVIRFNDRGSSGDSKKLASLDQAETAIGGSRG